MKEQYPYFIYPAVMALRQGVDDPREEKRLRRIVAANVGDIPALRLMLGIDPEEFASFYPDLERTPLSTNDTISSFLSHFGKEEAPLPRAAAEIPDILTDTAPSVSEIPAAQSSTSSGNPPQISEMTGQSGQTPAPTEQNAYILIKKHDYQGALEIIQQLSLNIPEKSVYFADQMRFLKKLIVNEARKNGKKTT